MGSSAISTLPASSALVGDSSGYSPCFCSSFVSIFLVYYIKKEIGNYFKTIKYNANIRI